MKLPVVQDNSAPDAWYADGLQFHCTQCGNCCTGGPGFVWITTEEIAKLAEFLKLTKRQTIDRYLRKIDGKYSLTEARNPQHGGYDCVFMREQPVELPDKPNIIAQPLRTCSIYPVRPMQCRTFPFWESNLSSSKSWKRLAPRCPGIDQGRRYTDRQIDSIRDTGKWPD